MGGRLVVLLIIRQFGSPVLGLLKRLELVVGTLHAGGVGMLRDLSGLLIGRESGQFGFLFGVLETVRLLGEKRGV
jgi:hypothetical protein